MLAQMSVLVKKATCKVHELTSSVHSVSHSLFVNIDDTVRAFMVSVLHSFFLYKPSSCCVLLG